jgi:hypothetical protein
MSAPTMEEMLRAIRAQIKAMPSPKPEPIEDGNDLLTNLAIGALLLVAAALPIGTVLLWLHAEGVL